MDDVLGGGDEYRCGESHGKQPDQEGTSLMSIFMNGGTKGMGSSA